MKPSCLNLYSRLLRTVLHLHTIVKVHVLVTQKNCTVPYVQSSYTTKKVPRNGSILIWLLQNANITVIYKVKVAFYNKRGINFASGKAPPRICLLISLVANKSCSVWFCFFFKIDTRIKVMLKFNIYRASPCIPLSNLPNIPKCTKTGT